MCFIQKHEQWKMNYRVSILLYLFILLHVRLKALFGNGQEVLMKHIHTQTRTHGIIFYWYNSNAKLHACGYHMDCFSTTWYGVTTEVRCMHGCVRFVYISMCNAVNIPCYGFYIVKLIWSSYRWDERRDIAIYFN